MSRRRTRVTAFVRRAAVSGALALVVAGPARAEDVDMAAISCQDLMEMSVEDVVVTGAWLSGYFNGRADNTVLDTAPMDEYGAALGGYCEAHPDATLMQAVRTLFVDAD